MNPEDKHIEIARDIISHTANELAGMMIAQAYLRGLRLIEEAQRKSEPVESAGV